MLVSMALSSVPDYVRWAFLAPPVRSRNPAAIVYRHGAVDFRLNLRIPKEVLSCSVCVVWRLQLHAGACRMPVCVSANVFGFSRSTNLPSSTGPTEEDRYPVSTGLSYCSLPLVLTSRLHRLLSIVLVASNDGGWQWWYLHFLTMLAHMCHSTYS
jgi:hypothetical protein